MFVQSRCLWSDLETFEVAGKTWPFQKSPAGARSMSKIDSFQRIAMVFSSAGDIW